MKIKNQKLGKVKILTISALCISSLLLTACSQDETNPLKALSNERVGKFLVKASVYAEQKLHLEKSLHKRAYLRCMQGALSDATCEKLYEAMVNYAKSDLDFKHLTVSELKEMKASKKWQVVRDEYDAAVFDYLD